MNDNQKHEIVLYQVDDANVCVSVMFKDETFWLTTKSMSELFGINTQGITKHLQNIYEEEELVKEATCSKMEQVQIEGDRSVSRIVDYYNLDSVYARIRNISQNLTDRRKSILRENNEAIIRAFKIILGKI